MQITCANWRETSIHAVSNLDWRPVHSCSKRPCRALVSDLVRHPPAIHSTLQPRLKRAERR